TSVLWSVHIDECAQATCTEIGQQLKVASSIRYSERSGHLTRRAKTVDLVRPSALSVRQPPSIDDLDVVAYLSRELHGGVSKELIPAINDILDAVGTPCQSAFSRGISYGGPMGAHIFELKRPGLWMLQVPDQFV